MRRLITKCVLAALLVTSTGVVMAQPAAAMGKCEYKNGVAHTSVRCRSMVPLEGYAATVLCGDGIWRQADLKFTPGANVWGPWSSTNICPIPQRALDHGVQIYS